MGTLDIIGSDERKVGYFAGLIVNASPSTGREEINFVFDFAGISLFRDRGCYSLSMESII